MARRVDAPAALFDDAVLGPNRREDSGDRNGQLVSVDQGRVTSRDGRFGQPPIMKKRSPVLKIARSVEIS
jgi:hypothetical protein